MMRYLVALIFIVSLDGCSEKKEIGPSGTLEGQVNFEGLPAGSQLVIEAGGTVSVAIISEGGKFSISNEQGDLSPVPVGEYRVAILPPPAKEPTPAEAEEAMKSGKPAPIPDSIKNFPVPEKFRRTETSPLRVKIEEGPNTKTFDIP